MNYVQSRRRFSFRHISHHLLVVYLIPHCYLPRNISILIVVSIYSFFVEIFEWTDRYLGSDAFPFSVNELRLLTILQRIPFVIPFDTRVQVYNLLLQEDKKEQQRGSGWGAGETNINLRIRRDYIYEDAFDKLRLENGNSFL